MDSWNFFCKLHYVFRKSNFHPRGALGRYKVCILSVNHDFIKHPFFNYNLPFVELLVQNKNTGIEPILTHTIGYLRKKNYKACGIKTSFAKILFIFHWCELVNEFFAMVLLFLIRRCVYVNTFFLSNVLF